MAKYVIVKEKSEIFGFGSVGHKNGWAIEISPDFSDKRLKYMKIRYKMPIWEKCKIAYISLLEPKYIPVCRKNNWILSNEEVDELIKWLNEEIHYLVPKRTVYQNCLDVYNSEQNLKENDKDYLPMTLPMPDYNKLKEYNNK